MMMIQRQHQQQHPTVEIPPWDPPYDDPTAPIFSPQTASYFSTLHKFLPSRELDSYSDSDSYDEDDSHVSDNFRMYEFKVRRCARGRSHDWTECPFAHPGEKARRRDPRKFHYSGVPCPEFRHGGCPKGDACEYAHGVFECWLHPSRYRTQPCKDGVRCGRRVCFFAHTPGQLRVLGEFTESGPSRTSQLGCDSGRGIGVSPVSVLEEFSESPPSRLSQLGFDSVGGMGGYPWSVLDGNDSLPASPSYGDSVSQLVNSVSGLQIGKSGVGHWGGYGSGYGSPKSPIGFMGGLYGESISSTPTRSTARSGLGLLEQWEMSQEEEMPMERVESGKDVRARIYAKLSEENSFDQNRVDSASPGPDFGWISELVK